MKAIYEETGGSNEDSTDEVGVTVLKAEYNDASATPRYLVELYGYDEGVRFLFPVVATDAEVIRWAQAQFDTLTARYKEAETAEE